MCFSLENDALMELFTVYLQVLISQAVDANFFATIEQGQGKSDFFLLCYCMN